MGFNSGFKGLISSKNSWKLLTNWARCIFPTLH